MKNFVLALLFSIGSAEPEDPNCFVGNVTACNNVNGFFDFHTCTCIYPPHIQPEPAPHPHPQPQPPHPEPKPEPPHPDHKHHHHHEPQPPHPEPKPEPPHPEPHRPPQPDQNDYFDAYADDCFDQEREQRHMRKYFYKYGVTQLIMSMAGLIFFDQINRQYEMVNFEDFADFEEFDSGDQEGVKVDSFDPSSVQHNLTRTWKSFAKKLSFSSTSDSDDIEFINEPGTVDEEIEELTTEEYWKIAIKSYEAYWASSFLLWSSFALTGHPKWIVKFGLKAEIITGLIPALFILSAGHYDEQTVEDVNLVPQPVWYAFLATHLMGYFASLHLRKGALDYVKSDSVYEAEWFNHDNFYDGQIYIENSDYPYTDEQML